MKTRAAVAFEAGKPLELVEIDLEGPKEGEVLIEVKATGICHTDAYTLSGKDPEGLFPSIMGHEGAGTGISRQKPLEPAGQKPSRTASRHPPLQFISIVQDLKINRSFMKHSRHL